MGSLEADFAALTQSHAVRNAAANANANEAKKKALGAASAVAHVFVDSVNKGVQEVFINEKRIDMESRALRESVEKSSQQVKEWVSMFHTMDAALKEIGDFENFIKVMEYDCESISQALRTVLIEKQRR